MAQPRVRDVLKKSEANEASIVVNRNLIYGLSAVTLIHICISVFF